MSAWDLRKSSSELVMHVNSRRYCEDIIQFFEGTLLGFWDPEEDHAECNDVQTGVKCKCALEDVR